MDLKLLVTFDLWGDLGKGGSPEGFGADINAEAGCQVSRGSFAGARQEGFVILHKSSAFPDRSRTGPLAKRFPKA